MLHQHPLERKFLESWPLSSWGDVPVLVAVSGGADSVALLRLLAALRVPEKSNLTAAHFNHRLRGEASDHDQQFVTDLSQNLAIPCEIGSAQENDLANSSGNSLEAAARKARYRCLCDVANRLGARYIVTAHTADDQAETILHRIVRGTGLGGLSGIPRTRPLTPATVLIRPMLAIQRSEVIDYLASLDQSYCEDQSNLDLRFTRNRIRHDLLPKLATDYNENVVEALLRLGELAGQAQSTVDLQAEDLTAASVTRSNNSSIEIDCNSLANTTPYLIREMLISLWKTESWPLQAMSFEKWSELAAMTVVDSASEKKIFPGGVCAEKKGGQLVLTRP